MHPLTLRREALRAIQDLVSAEKGSPLGREAVGQLESVLATLAGQEAPRHSGHSQREVSILFGDVRGFSAIARRYPADVVLGVLNRCFGLMVQTIARHYGTVDKFMGDAIMAVFYGEPASPRDHARRAVLCAVEMQLAMHELRLQHEADDMPQLYLGIGVSTGNVMAGLIGAEPYVAYTVIGEEVNLASRLEALSLRGQVLISEATYAHCADFAHFAEPMAVFVKGYASALRVRAVLGVPTLGKVVPQPELRSSPRVATMLRCEYRAVDGKSLATRVEHGVVRDIGYHGAAVELAGPLPVHSEISLAFELPQLGFRADEIYARVVSIRSEGNRHVAGVNFTSLSEATAASIRRYVQMLVQGE